MKLMNKRFSVIILIAVAAGLLFSLSACVSVKPSKEVISSLVADAVLSDNENGYLDGECSGEGHILLGSSVSGNRLKVYALTMYGNYGFRNNMFIKISGSGVIPAVLTFEKNGEEYKLLEIEYPRDGSEYTKSIKRLFPLRYRSAALHADNAHDELKAQEQSYAEAYLKSIGREAGIGEYGDINAMMLTDAGVSVDVSNQLCCDKTLGDYPLWIGTAEYLKGGKRYVRSLSYDDKENLVIYTTCEKESGEVIEEFVFDAVTGDSLCVSMDETVNIEKLKETCPEYFDLAAVKGIEVYVWQMAENFYRCGIMSGTNRNKTDEEIWGLQEKSLSIDEAKAILNELGVTVNDVIVIPIAQPYSSYLYEIDDEYTERVSKLFSDSESDEKAAYDTATVPDDQDSPCTGTGVGDGEP